MKRDRFAPPPPRFTRAFEKSPSSPMARLLLLRGRNAIETVLQRSNIRTPESVGTARNSVSSFSTRVSSNGCMYFTEIRHFVNIRTLHRWIARRDAIGEELIGKSIQNEFTYRVIFEKNFERGIAVAWCNVMKLTQS